jgi:CheY-like chemotaxis protein
MKSILLVDDNKYVLDALVLTLRDCARDCAILTAKNGREAVDIMDRNSVDLVLTDIDMPVMNGFELIAHKNSLHPTTPLLAMTSDASHEVVEKLRSLGITYCMEKPFSYEEVTQLVLKSLASH